MSGQALFWSVHHWSVHYQSIFKTDPLRQELTFCCVGDCAGVDGLAGSKLGKACDGNGHE